MDASSVGRRASAHGFKVATCLYDFFKAFEKVGFQRLVQEGCRTGSPVRQMKLLVSVYSVGHRRGFV